MARPSSEHLHWRARAALGAGRVVAGASRAAHLGSGSVIGGRLSLKLDPGLLATLTAGRDVALVSATNGKTTTTYLLATALAVEGPVVSNSLGANMPPGLVAALGAAGPAAPAVLEVDERWLPSVLRDVGPATVLLLNLSRDQLDRSHEVRKIADTWRATLASPADAPDTGTAVTVVANADDPLVVWAAAQAPRVVWVGTAAHWTNDAAGCPQCGGRIEFSFASEHGGAGIGASEHGPGTAGEDPAADDLTAGNLAPLADSWRCTACAFAKPEPQWWLERDGEDNYVVARSGRDAIELDLALPGRVNAANAAMVVAAAASMGVDPDRAAGALAAVAEVAGRYKRAVVAGATLRMLLAKNPAGWQEAIDMLGPPPRPLVAAINARIADGRDPSWLWDVPFERLRGRFVVVLGERRHDLAVRLRYAEVEHTVANSLTDAVRLAAIRADSDDVDLIANYTAFQDYLVEVGHEHHENHHHGSDGHHGR